MGKATMLCDTEKLNRRTVDEAVKKVTKDIVKVNKETKAVQRDYYKETERLLYSLPALRLKVAQDEEDLRNGMIMPKEKSKDIITPSKGYYGPYDPEAREAGYIAERIRSMERTKREVQRIERALETIQDDPYYDIIPMKYWDGLSPLEIAEQLNCDERTYRRHKKRLVNRIKIVLFGADAL